MARVGLYRAARWFWTGAIALALSFGLSAAAAHVDMPGCREAGRRAAESDAKSLIAAALVASVAAALASLIGRARTERRRRSVVVMVVVAVAAAAVAAGVWLTIIFPCATD
jgi:hypothetical protein